MRVPHGGQTGLALGVGARIGRVLRVAALELLARVDGGEVGQFLLARDLVGRTLDDGDHGRAANVLRASLCAGASRGARLDLWPINSAAFYVLAALFSTGPLPFRYLATVNKLARLSSGS